MTDANSRPHANGLSRRSVAAFALGALALPIARPAFGRGIEGPATAEDEKFMRLALEEAALGDYPFGAVIVSNGEVLARGRNLGIKEKDPTAHGEMVAIRNFLAAHGPEKLRGTTLYTSGESRDVHGGDLVVRHLTSGVRRIDRSACNQDRPDHGHDAEIADKTPFADIALTGGVLAEEWLKLFK